jgi:dTDP-4-dehydrorhamnose reductase
LESPYYQEGSLVWLIGNKGMLGAELSLLLNRRGIPHIGTGREVDITSEAQLAAFGSRRSGLIRWIVNCAAYTAVDQAEDDREQCRRVNAGGPGAIGLLARSIGAKVLHISTDYVFDGRGIAREGVLRPYREEDPANPIGVYGATKREGEERLLAAGCAAYIIRAAWLYGGRGNNFVRTMLRLMGERDAVSVVDDQRGSPTWAFDLAQTMLALMAAADAERPLPQGIYHFTNGGACSWFEFAREIYAQARAAGLLNRDCSVTPCSSAQFPAKVRRPAYSVLDTGKIKAALGIRVSPWEASLKEFLAACAAYEMC